MTIAAVLIGIVVGIAIGGAAVSLALRGRLVGAHRAAARAGSLDLEVRVLERGGDDGERRVARRLRETAARAPVRAR